MIKHHQRSYVIVVTIEPSLLFKKLISKHVDVIYDEIAWPALGIEPRDLH